MAGIITLETKGEIVGQTVKVLLKDGATVTAKVYGRLLEYPIIDWGTGRGQWTWQSAYNAVFYGNTLRE